MGKLPIIPFHKRYDVEFGSLATGLLPVAEDIPETASFLPRQLPWHLGTGSSAEASRPASYSSALATMQTANAVGRQKCDGLRSISALEQRGDRRGR